MIQFFLLQNRVGKTRLSKWYVPREWDEKRKIEKDVHRLITSRSSKSTNFVDYDDHKVVYRRYAGLYFTLCIDVNDNELAYLETIHLFVEVLDQYFGNVCELDLVFGFHKVLRLVDEYVLAGEVQETSKQHILSRIYELEKLE